MARKSRPRAGSLAFYPRKRAKRELPSFRSMPCLAFEGEENAVPLNFLGYKVGMTHVIGKDSHEKGATFGQDIAIPVTVIETPSLKVFGVRAYCKAEKGYGTMALVDVFAERIEKHLLRRLQNFLKPRGESGGKRGERVEKRKTLADIEAVRERLLGIVLLVHSQPYLTGIGKKKPEVFELSLSGNIEQQLEYAKRVLGGTVSVGDVFSELEFVDVKAVSKGKGVQGVVKRFGVKMHRPKAKKRRVVGSIGPWNPSTVMWTVPRPGQMGYHCRTELNKKILKIGFEPSEVNPEGGFKNYGLVRNAFVVLAGSVPGPAKRAVALRKCVRPHGKERHKIEAIEFIATKAGGEAVPVEVEERLLKKVGVEKEERKERKSVEEEIAEAVKRENK